MISTTLELAREGFAPANGAYEMPSMVFGGVKMGADVSSLFVGPVD
jgi:hypothetical protein